MYQVMDVPGRTGIRFHAGNIAGAVDRGLIADFRGCIGVGTTRGIVKDQLAVLNTRATIRTMEKFLDSEDFILEIVGELEPYE